MYLDIYYDLMSLGWRRDTLANWTLMPMKAVTLGRNVGMNTKYYTSANGSEPD